MDENKVVKSRVPRRVNVEPDLKKGGEVLRSIRESKRLSQEIVHEDTGIQLARLSLMERGRIKKVPSGEDLAALGVEYGLSPRTLFEVYSLPVVRTTVADSVPDEPEELVALRVALSELPDETSRQEVLGMLAWVVDMANAKIASVAQGERIEQRHRRAVRAKA